MVSFLPILREITKRKKTEEKLKEAYKALLDLEEYHSCFVRRMPAGVMVVDKKGKIIVFNTAAEEITSFFSEEMIGKICSRAHILEASPSCDLESLLVKTLKEGKQIRRGEIYIFNKNGGLVPLGFNTFLLKGSKEGIMGAAIVFSDLTKVKETESRLRLKDRLSDIGSLTSNIAHELRNPFNIIRMCAELLENNVDEAHKQDIKVILDQVSLCDQRLKELLIFCKSIPTAKLKEVNINKFLEALLKDLDKRNLFSNIKLVKKFDESLLPVLTTGEQLRHIFINLIENAIHAMKTRGRLIIRTDGTSGFIQIKIIDTGQGISSEAKEHIFEPFFSTREEGVGLGLSIVQKTVLDLDGTIEVESREGKGATFTVKLPIKHTKGL